MEVKKLLNNPQEEITRLCEIDLDDVDNCLREHSTLYGRAYAYFQQAKARENNAKWIHEKKKTQAFSDLRDRGEAVASAKELAKVEPAVIEATINYLKAEQISGILYALLKGLEHRKDMLIQISSREKKEYGNF